MLRRKLQPADASNIALAGAGMSPVRLALDENIRLAADLGQRIAAAEQPNPRLHEYRDRVSGDEAALRDIQTRESAEVRRYVEHGGAAPEPATGALRAAEAKLAESQRLLAAAETADAERSAHATYLHGLLAEAHKRQRALVADVLFHEAAPAVLKRLQTSIIEANAANAAARALAIALVDSYPGMTPGLSGNVRDLPWLVSMPGYSAHPGVDVALLDAHAVHARAGSQLAAFIEDLATNANAQLADHAG